MEIELNDEQQRSRFDRNWSYIENFKMLSGKAKAVDVNRWMDGAPYNFCRYVGNNRNQYSLHFSLLFWNSLSACQQPRRSMWPMRTHEMGAEANQPI